MSVVRGNFLELANWVKNYSIDLEGSHDWFHVERVWRMASLICREEGGNPDIVEPASLVHDLIDDKLGCMRLQEDRLRQMLFNCGCDNYCSEHVCQIINNISFRDSFLKQDAHSKEFQIVQDADRLDAIGAIGIARAFSYGGSMGRKIYDPEEKPRMIRSKSEYINSRGTSINHFFEKLLLIKDKLMTKSAQRIADTRHAFMLQYLERFGCELEEIGLNSLLSEDRRLSSLD